MGLEQVQGQRGGLSYALNASALLCTWQPDSQHAQPPTSPVRLLPLLLMWSPSSLTALLALPLSLHLSPCLVLARSGVKCLAIKTWMRGTHTPHHHHHHEEDDSDDVGSWDDDAPDDV